MKELEKTDTRIFPIDIDPIDAFIFDELGYVIGKRVPVIEDSRANDVVCGRLCRVRPATERYDALDILQAFEIFPLILGIFDGGLPGLRVNVDKGPMYMGVTPVGIGVLCFQPQTVSIEIEGLVVPDALECCRWSRDFLDVHPTIRYTCVLKALLLASGTSAWWSAVGILVISIQTWSSITMTAALVLCRYTQKKHNTHWISQCAGNTPQ